MIPDSCKKIDKSAFLNCGSLKKIYFNTDTVDIGLYAFGYYKDSDGDYGYYFSQIDSDSPFYPFAMLRLAEGERNVLSLRRVLRA